MRARRGRDAHVVAAIQVLRAGAIIQRHLVRSDAAGIENAIAAYREALAGWPELGAVAPLAHALVLRALVADEDARTRFETERRQFTAILTLRRVANETPEASARFRANTDLREAATLLASVAPERLRLDDLALADLLGDEVLRARGAPARARPDLRLVPMIEARLDPSEHETAERLAILGG